MDRKQFEARRREILLEESKQPLRWFYLSFADDDFLGACVVQGRGVLSAVEQAHALGINPGGQVLAVAVHPDDEERLPKNKLLSREEISRNGDGGVSVGELEDRDEPLARLLDQNSCVLEQAGEEGSGGRTGGAPWGAPARPSVP